MLWDAQRQAPDNSPRLQARHASNELQFSNLHNSDTNHNDTGSLSKYTTLDLRVGYRFAKLVRASFGVDNLTNESYFIGPHPFPHRTFHAELRVDY